MTDLEALVVAAYVFADEYRVPARAGRPALVSDAELVACQNQIYARQLQSGESYEATGPHDQTVVPGSNPAGAAASASTSVPGAEGTPPLTPMVHHFAGRFAKCLETFYALNAPIDYEPDESRRLDKIAAATGKSMDEVVYDLLTEGEGFGIAIGQATGPPRASRDEANLDIVLGEKPAAVHRQADLQRAAVLLGFKVV